MKTLRLILGDQLNSNHSWFKNIDSEVTYVMMEVLTETSYAKHHIQKVVGFFASMRNFAKELQNHNHNLIYIKLNDSDNLQSFDANVERLVKSENFKAFEYQLPDEYRVDQVLQKCCKTLDAQTKAFDSEHFLSERGELGTFFEGKKIFIMENFYHYMRKKHQVLMVGDTPTTGQWNYDKSNRKKIPKNHKPTPPL